MRNLTGGTVSFEAEALTVGELIIALDHAFPGTLDRLMQDEELKPGLAVAVDGLIAHRGCKARIESGSTVRLLPAVEGG